MTISLDANILVLHGHESLLGFAKIRATGEYRLESAKLHPHGDGRLEE